MTPSKYRNIRRTPTFISAYLEIRAHLKKSSPMAFWALPNAMTTILDVIDAHPHGWPLRRKVIDNIEIEFHLAIVGVAYRKLHVRYIVADDGLCHLAAVWVDGQDEPNYVIDNLNR